MATLAPPEAPKNTKIIVTETTGSIQERLDENISPLSYRDRVRTFLPQKQETSTAEAYFVSSREPSFNEVSRHNVSRAKLISGWPHGYNTSQQTTLLYSITWKHHATYDSSHAICGIMDDRNLLDLEKYQTA